MRLGTDAAVYGGNDELVARIDRDDRSDAPRRLVRDRAHRTHAGLVGGDIRGQAGRRTQGVDLHSLLTTR